jgi:hypothetical protein
VYIDQKTYHFKKTIFLKLTHRCNSISTKISSGLAWSYSSVIPALGRVRQEDHKFEANLGCIKRLCLKRKKIKQQQKQNPQLSFFLAVTNTLILNFVWECKKPRNGKAR